MVKCWDLEVNKVIRHYHGHLSGVYTLSLHPTLDILVTAGRDASARVWDMHKSADPSYGHLSLSKRDSMAAAMILPATLRRRAKLFV